jgi:hypothetical protein
MKEEIIVGYQLKCLNKEHVNKEVSTKTVVVASVGIGMQWNNPLCGCSIAGQDITKLYQEPE